MVKKRFARKSKLTSEDKIDLANYQKVQKHFHLHLDNYVLLMEEKLNEPSSFLISLQ